MRIRVFQVGILLSGLLLSLFVSPNAEAAPSPSITAQPENQSDILGSNATFTVTATGQTPLFYQWSFNGTTLTNSTHIAGARSATLTISNIVAADAGNYEVVVSNSHGSATSSNASLTVLVPAAIAGQPSSESVLVSSNASFMTAGTGTAPLNYQWYFNGTPLTDGGRVNGSTSTILNISNVQTSDGGAYQMKVANSCGSATSTVATLTVLVPPAITAGPSNETVVISNNASFVVTTIGTLPLNYQWYFNGSPLTDGGRVVGSTTTNLNIANVQAADAGSYQFIVTNQYGNATSTVASLTVVFPPGITAQPVNQTTLPGYTANFSVSATGTEPLSYQWQKDGNNLADNGRLNGSTSQSLTMSNLEAGDMGNYVVVVSNLYGAVASVPASLVVVPVTVWGKPEDGGVAGLPATLTNAIDIAAQSAFDLALKSDGTVIAWGDNGSGQDDMPAGLSNVVQIAVGSAHDLALSSDGSITGWGDNTYGESVAPAGLSNVVSIGAGYQTSVALKSDGTLVSWGSSVQGETNLPAGVSNIVAIAVGDFEAFAIKDDGTVIGWGSDNIGGGDTNAPTGLSNVVAVATGAGFADALKSDGTVVQWGYNPNCCGQINMPSGVSNVTAIAAGFYQTLALENDGTVTAWGGNFWGEAVPPSGLSNVVAVAAGYYHSMALVQNPAEQAPPVIRWMGRTNRIVQPGNSTVVIPMLSGSLPMNFQWYLNGAPLSGETNKWLALTSLQPGQSGSYYLAVTNNSGSATSPPVVIAQSPTIVAGPTNESVVLSNTATFSASVLGDGPLTYQWYFKGTPLSDNGRVSGSASANLAISNVQTSDAGAYQLVLTNAYGAATSVVATLSVLLPAYITSPPTNLTVLSGSNASFSVIANGTAPLSYLWYSNGVPLANAGRFSGVTNATLNITGVLTNDAANYEVLVTNSYGSVTSSVAALTVLIPIQIVLNPVSQSVVLGNNVTFSVAASGTTPGYQWYFNGTALSDNGHISGSGTSVLTVNNVQSGDAGGYVAVATNLLSSATSQTASLTPQAVLAPSTRYVALTSTNPMPPYLSWSTAATNIQDGIDAAVAGDSVVVSNGVYSFGARVIYPGPSNRVAINKAVTVVSVNGSMVTVIQGSGGSPATRQLPLIRCVYLTNGASLIGFALTNGGASVQGNAVTNASGGGVWCESTSAIISNCFIGGNLAGQYGGGAFRGSLFNCVVTNNSAPFGGGAASNVLLNVILTHNTTGAQNLDYGGGAYGCTLTNCLLVGNQAVAGSGFGGGAAFSTLSSCVLSNNVAGNDGGGLAKCVAYNCLVSSNRAGGGGGAWGGSLTGCVLWTNFANASGGGAFGSVLTNCTVVGNRSSGLGVVSAGGLDGTDGGGAYDSIVYDNAGTNVANIKGNLAYVCSIPAIGPGGFTNAPLFINESAGDFHLQSSSPCINSGNNAYVTTPTDFDGNQRIVGSTVDVGAYEYQTPTSIISYAWLEQYGLPTDGSADFADADGTGMNNWQKWIAGLNPTNATSVLAMQTPQTSSSQVGVTVTWLSVSNRTYYLQQATNLAAQPAFSTIQSNIVGQAGTTSYIDTTATNGGPYFYRVGVEH